MEKVELSQVQKEILLQLGVDGSCRLYDAKEIKVAESLTKLGYATKTKLDGLYETTKLGYEVFNETLLYGEKGTGGLIVDWIAKEPNVDYHFFLNFKPEYKDLVVATTQKLYDYSSEHGLHEVFSKGVEAVVAERLGMLLSFYENSETLKKLCPRNYPHLLFMNVNNIYNTSTTFNPKVSGLESEGYTGNILQKVKYNKHDWLEYSDLLDELCTSWAVVTRSDGNDLAFTISNANHFRTTQGYEHSIGVIKMTPQVTGDYNTVTMYGKMIKRRIDRFMDEAVEMIDTNMGETEAHTLNIGHVKLHEFYYED